ncbi:hypothetical protein CCACVL1_14967, partial [Corchorus capsularis]
GRASQDGRSNKKEREDILR